MLRRIAPFILTVFLCFTAAAFAQSGHFIESGAQAPICYDLGTQVGCGGKVSGLGGTTFEITLHADGLAIIKCENPGGNVAPGQDTEISVDGSTGPLPTPKNGNFLFSILTDAPVVPNYPTCPNPGWTALITDVVFQDAILTLFEDGVQVDQVIVSVQ